MATVFTVAGRGQATRRAAIGWGFVGPATLVVTMLSLLPAVWAFLVSRTRWNGISAPVGVGWGNYEHLARDRDALAAAGRTALLGVLFVPTSVLLGLLVAVALNRPIRFVGFYRTCVFVPYVASATATGLLANVVFDPVFGIVDGVLHRIGLPEQSFLESPSQSVVTLCVIALWGEVGFTAVVYLAALQDVPPELADAARVDGAGPWQIFRHVTVPALRPVTVFVAAWETLTVLQMFDLIYTSTGGGPRHSTTTIVYYVYELAFQDLRFGYGTALAYVLFALILVLTLAAGLRIRRAR